MTVYECCPGLRASLPVRPVLELGEGRKPGRGRELLDHLVGPGEEGWRRFEPDLPSGAKAEDEIELRRLLDGDLRGARSAKEPIDLVRDPFPVVDLVRTVRHQPAPPDVLAEWHCGREAMAKGELHERRGDYTALPRNNEERVGPVRQRFAESSLRCLSPRARERS